jgi:creatinine amidohydrolase
MRKMILLLSALLLLLASCSRKFGDLTPEESIFADTMVDMTWQQVKKAADDKAIVLLPIAVVEEHGPQMDLSPDIYQTCIGCRYVKRSLEKKGIPVIIAPPYYWGMSEVNKHIPGTFSVRADTFTAMLFDIVSSLESWGFTEVFCANLHGDTTHNEVLDRSITEIRNELNIGVYNIQTIGKSLASPPRFLPPRSGKFSPDYHAGADETAIMLSLYPQRVRTDIAEGLKPEASFDPLGYVGDPASYKLEKNAVENFRINAEYGAQLIEAFLKKSRT